jgi:hypothetical protein
MTFELVSILRIPFTFPIIRQQPRKDNHHKTCRRDAKFVKSFLKLDVCPVYPLRAEARCIFESVQIQFAPVASQSGEQCLQETLTMERKKHVERR